MAQRAQERRIDQFFFGPGARADEWRGLVRGGENMVERLGRSQPASKKNFLSWRSPKNIMPIPVLA